MPDVIDAFVVELGLDPAKFNKGQRDALDNFKKTQEAARKGAKDIEDSAKRGGEALSAMRSQALQMFAAFSGGAGVVAFVTNLTKSDAALGRLSRNIGVSASTINAWQGAARIFGSSAEGMASSFTSLSDAFAGWKIGIVSPIIADFRAISTAGGKVIDVNKSVEQSMLDLADNLKAIHDKDPAQAGLLGRRIGLDPGLSDLMMTRGSAGLQQVLDYVKKIGVASKEDVDTFGELEKRINQMGVRSEQLGRQILGGENGGASIIMRFADWLSNPNIGEAGRDAYNFWLGPNAWTKGKNGVPVDKVTPLFPQTSTAPTGAFTSQAAKEAFIRSEAVKRGIDPNIAMAVARSEGFNSYAGDKDANGNPTSFGAFQLHYPGVGRNTADGLGTQFTKQTGLDARDPATEAAQIMFALDEAKKRGWGDWHGAANTGIADWAGISRGGGGSTRTTEININGPININAGPNADGAVIAHKFRDEVLKRQSFSAQSNDGQQ